MYQYIVLLIILTSVRTFADDMSPEGYNSTEEYSIWTNFINETKSFLIEATNGLGDVIDHSDDVKPLTFVKFIIIENSTDIPEMTTTQATTVVEYINNHNIDTQDSNNDLYENDLGDIINNEVDSVQKNNKPSTTKPTEVLNQNLPATNTTQVTLSDAWDKFVEKVKLFMLTRDLEIFLPDVSFLTGKILRISLKNFVKNGDMIEMNLTLKNETVNVTDKIDQELKEGLQSSTPAQRNITFLMTIIYFFNIIYVLVTKLFGGLTLIPALFFGFFELIFASPIFRITQLFINFLLYLQYLFINGTTVVSQ
ncbi:uncharacterized protein LOC114327674 isoform X1 [Diabrotica virgifera virgifera]|uniref:Uncharacterized protein LOC114327674 isoform X1 n=1 Tax=Diabrotica virgifera virgifera TaxID=50390 RepID=A0A6P7FFY6_DIAVI|nr:uncharacterized protein LOC114327674 isoform X1 [Diabrotica virgifera virgifera]